METQETSDEIIQRHKKEKKDLQGKHFQVISASLDSSRIFSVVSQYYNKPCNICHTMDLIKSKPNSLKNKSVFFTRVKRLL